jgi:hypothetical protein
MLFGESLNKIIFYVTHCVLNCDYNSNSFYSFFYEKEKTGTGVEDPNRETKFLYEC